jgi:hypothetical protein
MTPTILFSHFNNLYSCTPYWKIGASQKPHLSSLNSRFRSWVLAHETLLHSWAKSPPPLGSNLELFKFQLNFGQTFIFFFSSLLLSLSLLQTDQGGKPWPVTPLSSPYTVATAPHSLYLICLEDLGGTWGYPCKICTPHSTLPLHHP